ncbi:MFS transporter [Croceiramulus getboli]|nr:MFS transporter [Flavobacteriaceae bacterium YJPT1-3]
MIFFTPMHSLGLILQRKRYFAPVWVFASLNIMMGTWVLHIPRIKEKLGIDDGELGVALFCYALGILFAITFASRIIKAIGVGRSTLIGILSFAVLFLVPVSVNEYYLLCGSLLITGIASSFTDIAMNALVSDIEVEDEINFMSAAHGFFSLGGVIGAGIGSLFIEKIDVSLYHMAGAAVVVVITNLLLAKSYLNIWSPVQEGEGKLIFSLFKPLLGLTLIALIVMGSEGSIEQWSKLYLEDVMEVSREWVAGLGFVIFSATMTTGRFFGDAVSSRFGSLRIIIAGCALSFLGYLGILSGMMILCFVGFGLVGLGFSVVIPELFRLAGKTKGVSSSEGISFVAGFGFVGFMAAPASMGFLADWSSLRLSYTVLAMACAVAFLIGLVLLRKK